MLHQATPAARKALLHMSNLSLDTGKLAKEWKIAKMIAIPKPDSDAFRPITLLSVLDKTVERMILNRAQHVVGNLGPNILGFVKGKGTADGLATVAATASRALKKRPTKEEAIIEQLSNLCRSPAVAIFIDLEKAFELARKEVILSELAKRNVSGKLLQWLEDYLTNRQAKLEFQNRSSELGSFENGTPQGSVISPFLFNIIMAALVDGKLYEKITILSYADDVVLVCHCRYPFKVMKAALATFEEQCMTLGLKISVNKTKAMCFAHSSNGRAKRMGNFTIQGTEIEWVKEYKYLGVIFDNTLSFRKHATYIRRKVGGKMNILRMLAGSPWGASTHTLKRYYLGAIRPILEYGAQALFIGTKTYLAQIENIQNRAMRIILGAHLSTPISILQAELGIMPLIDRRQMLTCSHYYKLMENPDPHPLKKIVPIDEHRDISLFQYVTWGSKVSQLYTNMELEVPEEKETETHPPWDPSDINNCIEIKQLEVSKYQLTPELAEQVLQERLAEIQKADSPYVTTYYTDGSVGEDGTASFGVHIQNPTPDSHQFDTDTLSGRIRDHSGSMITELAAIRAALIHAAQFPDSTKLVRIYTDSMSALLALQQKQIRDNISLISSIKKLIQDLESHGRFTFLTWVPSHIGIPGNEIADQIAKEAQNLPRETHFTDMSTSAAKNKIKLYFKEKWENQIKLGAKGRTLRYLDINQDLKPLDHRKIGSRIIQVQMSRMRMDDGNRCSCMEFRKCDRCGGTFSFRHYLLRCPALQALTQEASEVLTDDEFHLPYRDQEIIIIRTLTHNPHTLENWLNQYPIRATCAKGHGYKIGRDWGRIRLM